MTLDDMRLIQDIKNIINKKVIVRLELDVSLDGGKVRDGIRIRSSLQTLEYLRDIGSKIIIISHIGRDPQNTLKPVYDFLNQLFPLSGLIYEYFSPETKSIIEALKPGEAVMFENLRQHPEEEKNDEDFAKKLAGLADYYVNEAFAVSHRSHASIIGIPRFVPGFGGFVFQDEIKNLSRAFKPSSPSLVILGGAKFETKIPLIRKFLKIADSVFVGGALSNNYFREKKMEIGESIVSPGDFNISSDLNDPKLILPADVVAFDGKYNRVCLPDEVKSSEKIWDAGPKTIVSLGKIISEAKFILWNGPLGNYELGYVNPTLELTKLISQSSADTIVGGGDTLASIESLGLLPKFTFVSTGGGAMLEFLASETLPGIDALENSPKIYP